MHEYVCAHPCACVCAPRDRSVIHLRIKSQFCLEITIVGENTHLDMNTFLRRMHDPTCVYAWVCANVCMHVFVFVFVYLLACLPTCLPACLRRLFVCLIACLCVCVCLFVCLLVCLFASLCCLLFFCFVCVCMCCSCGPQENDPQNTTVNLLGRNLFSGSPTSDVESTPSVNQQQPRKKHA